MEKIEIGKVVNAVGLKGEVKVYNYSDYKERYEELDEIYIDEKIVKIEKVRYQQEMVILKLTGVDDRNSAETLKGKSILIKEEQLRELPEDTFYIKDLIGLKVVNDEDNSELGTLKDVVQNSAQDLYFVQLKNGGECIIPAVGEFVKSISMEEKVIRVKLIEGMLD